MWCFLITVLSPADLTFDHLWARQSASRGIFLANASVSKDNVAVEEEEDKLIIRYEQGFVCNDAFLFQEGEHVSCCQSGGQVRRVAGSVAQAIDLVLT